MCVICGYEIAGTWVRNGMVLGMKWYEFWVRNGMPGCGLILSPCDSIKLYLLKNMILYVKYNNNYLGTKWYGLGYEMVWDESAWVRYD